jgi:hypothetical protein
MKRLGLRATFMSTERRSSSGIECLRTAYPQMFYDRLLAAVWLFLLNIIA